MKKKIFFFFYDAFLHVLFIVLVPVLLKRKLFNSKYKQVLDRIGLTGIRKLRVSENRPVIWIHGASLGEILLTKPVIDLIKKKSPNAFIILTCVSDSGLGVAKNKFPHVDYVAYLPLDVSYLIRPVVKRLKPSLVILSENDMWLNFMVTCKSVKSRLIMINGKLSNKSFRNFLKFKLLSKFFLDQIDLFCVQDTDYKKKFRLLGVDEKKLIVTGNIKSCVFGSDLSLLEMEERKKYLGLTHQDTIFVLGSTHEGEEVIWLDIFDKLIQIDPSLKLIIVPRHITRVSAIQQILNQRNLTYGLWGAKEVLKNHKVLLVNVMGELCNIYQMAHYAFVGGTFKEKVGGHNLLEPLLYNIPLFFGPYTFSQSRIASLIIEKQCGIALTVENFESIVTASLRNKELLLSVVANGKKLLEEENSSLSKTWDVISHFIP